MGIYSHTLDALADGTEMKRDPLTALLNRIVAICETLGRGTHQELAKSLGISSANLSRLLKFRRWTPRGDIVLQLHEWAATQTLRIDKAGKGEEYRKRFQVVCMRFPLNGKKPK